MTEIDGPEQNGVDRAQAWERVLRRLRAELGEDVYSSWFGRLELVAVSDGVAQLSVPTRFLKSWIQSHYLDKVRTLTSAEIDGVRDIALGYRGAVVRNGARAPAHEATAPAVTGAAGVSGRPPLQDRPAARPIIAPVDRTQATELDGIQGSPLDRRLTLANFLIGRSNALAHAAAERVARIESSGTPLYNPLYIHASVGLGKTHLLQAVAHEVLASGKRVIYLTADRFMYGFVAALKAQTALAFKERLRGIDLLVIDDVQFLQGKSIQQDSVTRSMRSSTRADRSSSPPIGLRPTSRAWTSAYARALRAGSWSRWGPWMRRCASRSWRPASPPPGFISPASRSTRRCWPMSPAPSPRTGAISTGRSTGSSPMPRCPARR